MAIKYYPNRIFKKDVPAIDRVLAKRRPQLMTGTQVLDDGNLEVALSSNTNWQVNSILFDFSSATAKDFSAYVKSGRKVVTDLNDYLWIHLNQEAPQKITLDPGFYTGTELAAHLKTKMDANAAFAASSITFTVTYTVDTGVFQIVPSARTVKYLDVNTAAILTERDSIAGHLFGFTTTDATFGSNIESDEAVPGLDGEFYIINEDDSTETSLYHDDIHILNIDQELTVYANSAGATMNVNYAIGYEDVV